MLNKKCFGAVMLAAAAVSTSAVASDRGVNTAVGAVLGAAVGHNFGGRDGAIVGGVLGAAVGNSVNTNDRRGYRDNRGYDNRGYDNRGYDNRGYNRGYTQVSYYEPAPVYYAAPRRYYREPAVVYVEPRRGHHGYGHGYGHRHDRYDRDDRGYGRDYR
jgi:hypothetical protein